MAGKLHDWNCGEIETDPLKDALSKIITDQIDVAINQIFGDDDTRARTIFVLSAEGLQISVFDGDYEFLIPWERLHIEFSSQSSSDGRREEMRKIQEELLAAAADYYGPDWADEKLEEDAPAAA